VTDEQLDALLESDRADNPDNQFALFLRIHERKRKLAHARAKATQPALGIRGAAGHPALLAKLKAAWDAPLTDDDKSAAQGDIEYLILTVQDCVDDGDVEDLIFAAMRLSRKLLGRNPALWRAQDVKPKQEKA